MFTAERMKWSAVAVLLLAVLAGFDIFNANNELTGAQIATQTTLPDIIIENLTAVPTTFNVEAKNVKITANITLNKTYWADVDVNFDVVLRLNGKEIGKVSMPRLKFGDSHSYEFDLGSVRSDFLIVCGINTFELSVDEGNAVAEAKEGNNKKSVYVYKNCATHIENDASVAATATSNNLTLKADSFSAVALGAAFGSYYNPSRSTCKPDNLFLLAWVSAPSTKQDEEDGEPYSYESKYENVLLFDLDEESNELKVKPKETGHRAAMAKVTVASFSANRIENMSRIEAAGAWILNNGPECQIAFSYDAAAIEEISENSQIHTGVEAANFISVVPQMIGRNLSVVSDSNFGDPYNKGAECKIFAAYSNFNGATRTWETIDPIGHIFAQSELGMGMWVFALDRVADRDHCALRFNEFS